MNKEANLATFRKFETMKDVIAQLQVRDKRAIFLLMRTAADELNTDTFFPLQGFTAGEFAVGQVLAENNRKQVLSPSAPKRDDPAIPPPPRSGAAPSSETPPAAKKRKKLASTTLTAPPPRTKGSKKKSLW